METLSRGPFEGVLNIIRFNWHFFALAIILVASGLTVTWLIDLPRAITVSLYVLILPGALATIVSLFVSWFIYDHSTLYTLQWLPDIAPGGKILNVNAGFDETSALLLKRFPGRSLDVFDFYDRVQHNEVSIRRARRRYPPHPGTVTVSSEELPMAQPYNLITAILSAHEIRSTDERIRFFSQLRDGLTRDGSIVLAEHLRDLPNFLAYHLGFFHFLSRREWERTFSGAQLSVEREFHVTPFITIFILKPNGHTSSDNGNTTDRTGTCSCYLSEAVRVEDATRITCPHQPATDVCPHLFHRAGSSACRRTLHYFFR
jgi:hypothetical protein